MCPDGTPWPCSPARVQLTEAYAVDPIGLAADLAAMLPRVADETGIVDPAELHERFVSWTFVGAAAPAPEVKRQ